jgi:putative FmdB family regulatory protein
MPFYEFQCEGCLKRYDELVQMGQTQHTCPNCGGLAKKSAGSYLFSAHGLMNGHIGVKKGAASKLQLNS